MPEGERVGRVQHNRNAHIDNRGPLVYLHLEGLTQAFNRARAVLTERLSGITCVHCELVLRI